MASSPIAAVSIVESIACIEKKGAEDLEDVCFVGGTKSRRRRVGEGCKLCFGAVIGILPRMR